MPLPAVAASGAVTTGEDITGEWPLHDCITFGALTSAVPCARLHSRLVLAEWGHQGVAEPAELIVSELVTNAITASQALDGIGHVLLWLLADVTRVLIAVWDASPRLPALVNEDDLAEGGRGLHLVGALALRWEAYTVPGHRGKIVQAVIAAEETGGAGA
jgi:anti-sigma regulatory factor (Ser/Thr protein kinase)